MPKRAKELTALAVSKLKIPGRYSVGGVEGLMLRVEPGFSSWVLRAVVGKKLNTKGVLSPDRRDFGLGPYPRISLADARRLAYELRQKIASGEFDPTDTPAKQQRVTVTAPAKDVMTFEQCARAYIQANRSAWKSDKHEGQWHSSLAKYVYPLIGDRAIDTIITADVLQVLQQSVDDKGGTLWNEKTESASRIRGRIETILDWAGFRGYRCGENPARWKGHLQFELPSRSKIQKVAHHSALPYAEVKSFIVELRKREGIAARALEFAILTAARSSEVRGATWDEFDLKQNVWIIPAERMKAGKEHRVPLSSGVIELLKNMPRVKDCPYVFFSPRGGMYTDVAMLAVLKRMGRSDITQHGFRSTFRDWAGETTDYPREVCEHALAHRLADGVEAAYQRGDMLRKRALLMQDWSNYCGY